MIIYGNGQVLFDGDSQGFEMRYRGAIRITNSPDNLFLSASENKIIGVMLDGTDMPQELFNYVGELRVVSCKSVQGNALEREIITVQGVDYWELDSQRWEDDASLWGTSNGTYLKGSRQIFNKHSIVVNNNIKTESEGQYQYQDGTPVPANELIHIHADGVVMTGGVHTEDSVQIYPPEGRKRAIRRQISQIRRATTTYSSPSSGSSSGSSGGGGGY